VWDTSISRFEFLTTLHDHKLKGARDETAKPVDLRMYFLVVANTGEQQSELLARHRSSHWWNVERIECTLTPVATACRLGGAIRAASSVAASDGGLKDNTWEVGQVEGPQHVAGLGVDLDDIGLDGGDLRNEVHATLALLLLQLEGNTAYRSLLDSSHEMRDKTSDLVAQALGRDDCNFIADTLVGLKVKRQPRIVLLNDDARRLLDGLGTNATLRMEYAA
jgi:hypothetical protein